MKNLTLNVKKKWFDMILSGVKKEEYREITARRMKQLAKECNFLNDELTLFTTDGFVPEQYQTITFLNGMKPKTPTIIVECKGIEIGNAVPEWSDNWQGEVFKIKIGNIIETRNCA